MGKLFPTGYFPGAFIPLNPQTPGWANFFAPVPRYGLVVVLREPRAPSRGVRPLGAFFERFGPLEAR